MLRVKPKYSDITFTIDHSPDFTVMDESLRHLLPAMETDTRKVNFVVTKGKSIEDYGNKVNKRTLAPLDKKDPRPTLVHDVATNKSFPCNRFTEADCFTTYPPTKTTAHLPVPVGKGKRANPSSPQRNAKKARQPP
jgi:hypothetical protein